MHALIIEDSYLIAATIEQGLREIGFTSFDLAALEDEAIVAAKIRCPDLITADDMLRQGSGVAAIRKICAAKPIPVIFILADDCNVKKYSAKAVVLKKPFLISDLPAAVEKARSQI